MKAQRQAAILELVTREHIPSQERLRQMLLERGFDVTQATLSRDIKDLGLVKRPGDRGYERPADTAVRATSETTLRRTAREFLRSCEVVQNLVLLKTDPGRAQILAVDLNRAALPEVAGTIGGDDTILVVTRDTELARRLAVRLAGWVGITL